MWIGRLDTVTECADAHPKRDDALEKEGVDDVNRRVGHPTNIGK